MPRKKTKEEVLSEFHNAHDGFYDYSLMIYKNTSIKITVLCPQHGVFDIAPSHHKKGVGCKKCWVDKQRTTKQEFIIQSKKHFSNSYDYSFFDSMPITRGETVKIFCITHNQTFLQEPRNHMKGHTGCPKCKSVKQSGISTERGKIKTQEELNKQFIKKACKTHGNIYDYSQFEYISSSTKGIIICSLHGQFLQTPSNHFKDTISCPECSLNKRKEATFKKECLDRKVDYARALKRRQAGLSDEKIFEQDFIRHSRKTNPITILGKIYPNLKEAIRELSPVASIKTIARWLEKGMSPEEAFDRIPNPGYAKGIIYLITNNKTGKKYIGLTIQTIERRWQDHIEQAKAGYIKHKGSLHVAIIKYNPYNFSIEIIDHGTSKIDLETKECQYIKDYKTLTPNGYNISSGGTSGGADKKPTTVDGKKFESVKKASEYIAETRNISIGAAKRRIQVGRIDPKPRKKSKCLSKTKRYGAWSRIIHGVLNPKSKEYIMGITVCEDWRDFKTFYKDVGKPLNRNMVFTRLDKSKGFFPENCQWLSKSEASKINAAYMKKTGRLTGRSKYQYDKNKR